MIPTQHLRIHQYAALQPGPKLIVTGAVHGNEVHGSKAMAEIMKQLDSGELTLLRGVLTFVPIVNPLAHTLDRREGDRNLNRNLRPPIVPQDYEDRIARQLCPLLAAHDGLLDLHSFQSQGQPFAMVGPRNNTGELEPFAHEAIESAVVARLGVNRIVEGWLSTYAEGIRRRQARASDGSRKAQLVTDPHYGVGTTEYMRSTGGWAITLECGQHMDPNGPTVARLAILRTLVHLGMLAPEAVEPFQPTAPLEMLRLYDVIDRESMDDHFAREWKSFDAVTEGDLVGTRANGEPVLAPSSGRIVFPNVKSQPGTEWFYLARASDRLLA
ncbi:succinylglutamate desuccinylase/aspartoacylase family protein [Roseateles sp.]|uniref:succinylglutamate desuccinylase/aspartoacylase domain-containing protein n=1 Tax=Roseateles sp. TaxID=1971397 RepID=UPI0039201C6E